MFEVFQKIKEQSAFGECMLLTVLEGERAGQKQLYTEKEIPEVFQHSGIYEREGQKVFAERFRGRPRLVICGGGTVGQALIPVAKHVGFFVTVIEDREEFAQTAKELGADEIICQSFDEGLDKVVGNGNTFFVVVTRDHAYDANCLKKIISKKSAYIGMMGSKKRVALLRKQLIEDGISTEKVETVHAPIGLTIHSETPEEIAISIMAEIIQCKNEHIRTEGFPPMILQALLGKQSEDVILATIVERVGSTPRGIGAKMVVRPDGSKIGSIGGGVMEAEIIRKTLELFQSEDCTCVHQVSMSGNQAEELSSMLCGGNQLVFIEKIGYGK